MLKMILGLPKRVDSVQFTETAKEILRGRYGKNSYYSNLAFEPALIESAEKTSAVFAKGFAGNARLTYYEVDAEELAPVIITAIEDLSQLVGAKFSFVNEDKKIPRDWWKPSNENFQTWHGKRQYCDDSDVETARDEYDHKLADFSEKEKKLA